MISVVANKIKNMIARGSVKAVNDKNPNMMLQVEVLSGEIKTLEFIQPAGFSHHPLPGAKAIILFVGGDRDKGTVIGVEHPEYREPDKAPGETVAYDAFKQKLHFHADGSVHLKTNGVLTIDAADKVRMNTNILEVTGDIIDNVDNGGRTMSGMRDLYDNHDHNENDSGGPTDTPNQKMGGSL